MNDGTVPFHADHDQDKYRGCRTQAVHELVHLAEKVAKDPTEMRGWKFNIKEVMVLLIVAFFSVVLLLSIH